MRLFRLTIVFCSAIILSVAHGGTLEEGFRRPPDTARLWVYWTQSGHDSLESATADLEAIKKAGIGGVLRMDCSVGQVPGGSAFLSEQWREQFVHSVYECERLGLAFGVCVCFPGAVSCRACRGRGCSTSEGGVCRSASAVQHGAALNVERHAHRKAYSLHALRVSRLFEPFMPRHAVPWLTFKPTELLPSGLLGPVTLQATTTE